MYWELIKVSETEWKQDKPGIFTLISYCPDGTIRLDVMTTEYEPVISFQGTAENVRKCIMQWQDSKISQKTGLGISCEHASYIGSELARAELLKTEYVQS